jgi:2-C-methyl-D-erythritol 4-phosphate cytidylyltransferase
LVQTPQCFTKEILVQAYKIPFNPALTDDATLVEQMGVEIQLVDGNEENIKITTPFDLLLAEEIAKYSGK